VFADQDPDAGCQRPPITKHHHPVPLAHARLGVCPARVGRGAYLIAVYATRKTILASAWPFCGQCEALRIRNRILGLSGIAVGIGAFCSMAAVTNADFPGAQAIACLLAILFFAATITGVVVTGRASPGALAQAWVREDCAWLDVWSPNHQFAAQVAAVHPQAVVQPTYIMPPR
jgi:hypothetical protein